MLMIRLQRVGRRNDPSFRVVATESKNGPQSGKFLEVLGSYNARKGDPVFDADRVKHWMSMGAQVSDTVHNLLISNKIIEGKKINVLPKKSPVVKEVAEEEKKEEATAEVTPETEKTEESTPEGKEEKTEAPATEPEKEKVEEDKSEEKPKEETPAEEPKEESEPVKEETLAEEPKEDPKSDESDRASKKEEVK